MKTTQSTNWIIVPAVLTALAIMATALYLLNDHLKIECVDFIIKSTYTLPSINGGILLGSIILYYISRTQEGKSGSVISMFSLSLLSLSNLSIVSDLMKMADDINVNQKFTFSMISIVIASYVVIFLLFKFKKDKNQPSDKKVK